MSGAAPDPLDRVKVLLAAWLADASRWDSPAEPEIRELLDALAEVARARGWNLDALRVHAREATFALWESSDEERAAADRLRAALARLDGKDPA